MISARVGRSRDAVYSWYLGEHFKRSGSISGELVSEGAVGRWSDTEKALLMEGVRLYSEVATLESGKTAYIGTRWVEVAQHVRTRPPKACRLAWNRRQAVKETGMWSLERDMLLFVLGWHAVGDSVGSWTGVSDAMWQNGAMRTDAQCLRRWKDRYEKILNQKWTANQEAELIQAVKVIDLDHAYTHVMAQAITSVSAHTEGALKIWDPEELAAWASMWEKVAAQINGVEYPESKRCCDGLTACIKHWQLTCMEHEQV